MPASAHANNSPDNNSQASDDKAKTSPASPCANSSPRKDGNTLVARKYPESTWQWFGHAGHFICGQWCRFHLTTKVGPWLVSTVGEYVHPRHCNGNERAEAEWLIKNPQGEEIGCGRFYETMVFRAGKPCEEPDCSCGLPSIDGSEVDFSGYKNAGDATRGHAALCLKYAGMDIGGAA